MDITSLARAPRRAGRLAQIVRIFIRHGLGQLVHQLNLQRHLPPGSRIPASLPSAQPEAETIPNRLAAVVEELGPTFVKFAQMLSTRPDMLPKEYIKAFQRVYHHVAPFPTEEARKTVEEELGVSIDEVFVDFSEEPLASGSMAQVHSANLKDGRKGVVKVKRPGIERTIDDDMVILLFLATQAERLEALRVMRIRMMAEEFARGIRRELDFVTEASYTSKFVKAFEEDGAAVAPNVFWEYTTSSVLTLEYLTGSDLADVQARGEEQFQGKELARCLVQVFLKQFFEMGIFHADPHPGNIRVLEDGRLALIDFGLIGHVTSEMQNQLIAAIIAASRRDFDMLVDILTELGIATDETDVASFRLSVIEILDKYYGIPLYEVDVQRFVLEIMRVIREHHVHIRRDFVLMGKAVGTVGGMALQLDPEMDVAELLSPYARRILIEKLSPTRWGRSLAMNAWIIGSMLTRAPRELRALYNRLKQGNLQLTVQHKGFEDVTYELDRASNRLAMSIMLAAIVVGSSIVLASEVGPFFPRTNISILGILGFVVALVFGFWLIWKIFSSGGL